MDLVDQHQVVLQARRVLCRAGAKVEAVEPTKRLAGELSPSEVALAAAQPKAA